MSHPYPGGSSELVSGNRFCSLRFKSLSEGSFRKFTLDSFTAAVLLRACSPALARTLVLAYGARGCKCRAGLRSVPVERRLERAFFVYIPPRSSGITRPAGVIYV